MNKIGIFGGAFNPIHYGHLFIAKESLEVFGIQKIIFIPTGSPSFNKKDLLDKWIRLEFVKCAISNEEHFEIDNFEVKNPRISYFIYTLNHVKEKFPNREIFSIIGEDAFLQFHKWKSPLEILEKTNIIIAKRFSGNFEQTKQYISKNFKAFKNKIFFLDHPLYTISSTLIRERIKNGKSISYLVPECIEREIIKNAYYR
jgi:nicotinate-nucleotide adenylyltransferase